MPASTRWFIHTQAGRRPPLVLLGGFVLALTAALGVGFSVWTQGVGVAAGLAAGAATLALLAGCFWANVARERSSARLHLAADADGHWFLQQDGAWRAVTLGRVWRGPCWVSLVLSPADGSAKATTLTVWRGVTPSSTWRKLCILLRVRAGGKVRGNRAEAR